MKIAIKILSIFLLHTFVSFSQQTDNAKIILPADSLKIKTQFNSLLDIQIKFDEFELHRKLHDLKMQIPLDGDPQTVWLRTSLAISNTENLGNDFSPHFLSPLEKQYLENSKFDPVRYVLGVAQLSAVGYLAYKHIKKYGFLK